MADVVDTRMTVQTCPECGQPHKPGAKFCSECGAKLAAEPVRETRKTVTAVFADVVGSTPLQEVIDAEAAHHVMARFYDTMREALEAHGGQVAKFIGDAVVALFGFPAVREDDALRAVRAAHAMRGVLAQLNAELEQQRGVEIAMRVGVNTGEVVISPEGLAIGDAMNVAARLEQNAPKGEILIGEATWRHVRHAVRCEALEPLALKGKSEPVVAYRLIDVPAQGEQRARIEAPLVGRDAELGRLVSAFEAARGARACRLVTVVGSPGLGKTRLAEELARTLAQRASVVHGRCEPTGEGMTFLPVAEVLRGAAGLEEADPAGVVREKLAALVSEDPDRDLLVERAAGILGLAAAASPEETFWSVRRLLGGLGRRRPLVVVLDDVHWGQPTFLDLIEHLAEWGRESPILLLALARPELRDMRPALAEPGRAAHDVVELAPLADDHSRLLVEELLDRTEMPEALAARVLSTTGGNPLFLGETLRMLVDDGVLRRGEDGWVVTGDAEAVDVPENISALLAARIERLDDDERSVVERAAVIGKQFYRGAVAELAPAPVAEHIDGHLEALHRKEVVEPEGTTWIDEPVFRFHHVLIRDAAYRALLKEARAELHERFADWLEAKAGELVGEHEEVIAFHLEQAHEYRLELGLLDERGEVPRARAVARLHSAGRRALAREDLPAATNLLGRAARALGDRSERAGDVLIDDLEALLSAGDTAEAEAVAVRLEALPGDERARAWSAVARAQLANLTDTTRLRESLDALAGAAEALAKAGDDAGVAKAHHVRAQALALLGQVGDVEAALDQALAAARAAGDTRRVTAVLSGSPRAALWGPSAIMRASGRCLDVVRILRMTRGNRHVEAVALRCQAVLEAMRGRADAARQILDRCRMTLEELGLGMELLETEQYAGIVELVAGDAAAAERHLRAAYDGFHGRGLDVGAASAAALLARALLEQDRDREAEDLTRFSEQHGGEDLKTTIAWCGARAQVLARRGEHALAESLARRAVGLADATDALIDHGDARLALAEALRAGGREQDASAEARRAAELYEAKGYEVGAARAAAIAGEAPPASVTAEAAPAPESVAPAPGRFAELRAGTEGSHAEPREVEPDRGASVIDRLTACFNARDFEGVRACLTDDYVLVDHRPVSPLGQISGPDEHVASLRSVAEVSSDLRFNPEHLGGIANLHLARSLNTGHQDEGGGAFEVPIRGLFAIRTDRLERVEVFDADDEAGVLQAMFRLLEDAVPADDESTGSAAERPLAELLARYLRTLTERDWEAARACVADDVVVVDERAVSVLGSLVGGDAVVELSRSLVGVASDAVASAEPLAESTGLLAVRAMGWSGHYDDGGGAFDLRYRVVIRRRGDVMDWIGLFDPDDEAGMLDALARLWEARRSATETVRGELTLGPSGQVMQRLADRINTRELDGVRSCFADDSVFVDHRPVSPLSDVRDPDVLTARIRAMFDVASDARVEAEHIAELQAVWLGLMTWRGHQDDSGGAFENPFRCVSTTHAGTMTHIELFDLDDERGAAQAFARLLGAEGEDRTTRVMRGVAEAFNARAWDELRARQADDHVMADHRLVVGHGFTGAVPLVERVRGLVEVAPDIEVTPEFLTEIGGVCLVTVRYFGHMDAGGGPFELTIRGALTSREGQLTRLEMFDEHDEAGMWAALARLRAEASGPAAPAPAQAPPAPAQAPLAPAAAPLGPAGRVMQRFADYINARALDRLRGCLADDCVSVDHRPVSPLGEYRDPDLMVAAAKAMVDVASDALFEVEHIGEVEGAWLGRVGWRGHQDDTGGAFDNPFRCVITAHAETITRAEFFEPEDERGAAQAFARLLGAEGEDAATRLMTRAVEAYNARALDALEALQAPGMGVTDHRRVVGHGFTGEEGLADRASSYFAVTSDIEMRLDPLADLGSVAVAINSFSGHFNDGGGPFELSYRTAFRAREERIERAELFDLDDEAGMWAALARLRTEASGPAAPTPTQTPPGPAGRVMQRLADCTNARALDGVRGCLADDVVYVDHRLVSPHGEYRDPALIVAAIKAMLDVASDARIEVEHFGEVEAVGLGRNTWRGHQDDTGGAFENPSRWVISTHAGTITRIEAFEPDDEAGALRAFARLVDPETGGDAGPATDVLHAAAAAFAEHDWDRARSLFAPDLELIDHRRVASFAVEAPGGAGLVERVRGLLALASDAEPTIEPLAEIDGVAMALVGWSGHLDDGGGAFEVRWRALIAVRDGVAVRYELFDEDAEAGMLAALARFRGSAAADRVASRVHRRTPAGLPEEPLPSEIAFHRLLALGDAGDWERATETLDPALVVRDHRAISTYEDPAGGREPFLARTRSLNDNAADVVRRCEVIAADEAHVAGIFTARGRLIDGDGPFELAYGVLVQWRDERLVRVEIFEADDEPALLARYAELSGQRVE